MFGGPLEVGNVFTKVGFRVDDSGATQYERRVAKVKTTAKDAITTNLGFDAKDEQARRYESRLDALKRGSIRPIITRAKVDEDDQGARSYESRLDRLRRAAVKPIVAHARFDADTRGVDTYSRRVRAADQANSDFVRGSGRLKSSFGYLAIGGAGVAGAATALYGFSRAGTAVISTASDISESLAKNEVLFGKYSKGVKDFADTSARSYGISKTAALEYTGTFGNLFGALGIGQKESAKYSVQLNKLAADMASFNNTSVDEALEAIRSGLVGETEPLRKFGVNINDATLRAEALKLGLIKTTKEALDPQTKALASQALITKQTSAAHGDFARTSTGLANQQRILSATVSNLGAKLGTALLPTVTKVVAGTNKLIASFTGGSNSGSRFITTAKGVAKWLGDGIGDAVTISRRALASARSFLDDHRKRLQQIGNSVSDLGRSVANAFGKIVAAFKSTFSGNSSTSHDIKNIMGRLLDLVGIVTQVYDTVAKRALPGIVTAFRGLFQALRGVLKLISGLLSGDFGKMWDGVKDIFAGGVKIALGELRAITAPAREIASRFGHVVGGEFSKIWSGIISTAKGFVNDIIDVINVLPGVNIGHVGNSRSSQNKLGPVAGGSSAKTGSAAVRADAAPQHLRTGGRLDQPVAIMGEEAPAHPEWVIPTNPAYRDRAVGLWMATAKDLGIPGFALGGLFSPSKAVDFVTGLPGKAVSSAKGIVSSVAGKLPHSPGGIISGAYDWVLDKAKDFIGDKAKGVWNAAKGLLGAGSKSAPSGSGTAAGSSTLKAWLSQALHITGQYSPANLAALTARALFESGGNPKAINLTDINAQQGHPSKGLLQTIDGTFSAYALPGHGDIWNPVDNAIAAIRYMISRYGHIMGNTGVGYRTGGRAFSGLGDIAGSLLPGGARAFARGGRRDGKSKSSSSALTTRMRSFVGRVWGVQGPMMGDYGRAPTVQVRQLGEDGLTYPDQRRTLFDSEVAASALGDYGNWDGRGYDLDTIIHELAHVGQRPGLSATEAEGGASLYAFRNTKNILGRLGIKLKSFGERDPYQRQMDWARKHRTKDWVQYGQFGIGHDGHPRAKPKKGKSKPPPRHVLTSKQNRGITRSVARGESGIANYEQRIQDAEREYTQMDTRFGLSDEQLTIENDDGSVTVNTTGVNARKNELYRLYVKRQKIQGIIESYRAKVKDLVETLRAAVKRLQRALAAAKGRARAKERSGYREAISGYQKRIGELVRVSKDLGYDITDQEIDLSELSKEHSEVASTVGSAASSSGASPEDLGTPDIPDTPDTPADPGTVTAPPTAADIAASAIAEFTAFQSDRAALFADFGNNFVQRASAAGYYADPTAAAAGAQYFGAAGTNGLEQTGTVVNLTNHYAEAPAEPDTWAHQQRFALEGALG